MKISFKMTCGVVLSGAIALAGIHCTTSDGGGNPGSGNGPCSNGMCPDADSGTGPRGDGGPLDGSSWPGEPVLEGDEACPQSRIDVNCSTTCTARSPSETCAQTQCFFTRADNLGDGETNIGPKTQLPMIMRTPRLSRSEASCRDIRCEPLPAREGPYNAHISVTKSGLSGVRARVNWPWKVGLDGVGDGGCTPVGGCAFGKKLVIYPDPIELQAGRIPSRNITIDEVPEGETPCP